MHTVSHIGLGHIERLEVAATADAEYGETSSTLRRLVLAFLRVSQNEDAVFKRGSQVPRAFFTSFTLPR